MPYNHKLYFGPKNLDLPPQGGLLIIRHSERYPILLPAEAYVAGLTEHGRRMARAFGENLGHNWRIGEVVASPVTRCVETAEQIINGAVDGQYPHPLIRPMPLLHFDQKLSGIPGLAGIYLDDTGFTELAARPGSPDYSLYRASLLAALPFPTQPGTINLAVTHDVVLTFFKASLLGWPRATLRDLPDYLEGILLVKQGDSVRLV